METIRRFLGHPSIRTGIGTAIGYGLILALLLVALFILPYVIFTSL